MANPSWGVVVFCTRYAVETPTAAKFNSACIPRWSTVLNLTAAHQSHFQSDLSKSWQ